MENRQITDIKSKGNFPYKPLTEGGMDEALRKKAREELNENEETVKEGKRRLRKLLIENDMPYHDNEVVLIQFLRVKKFRPKESYELLMNSMKSHRVVKKNYGLPKADVIKKVLEKNVIGLLPYRDSEGSSLAFCRSGSYINAGLTYSELTQATVLICFYLAEQPASHVAGVSLIIDAKDACVQQLKDLLSDARILLPQLRGYAARVKSIHVVNEPSYIKLILEVVRLFVPKKIMKRHLLDKTLECFQRPRSDITRFESSIPWTSAAAYARIILHGSNMESLQKYYDPSILPYEFGGTCGPLSNKHWAHEVDSTLAMYCHYNDIAMSVKKL